MKTKTALFLFLLFAVVRLSAGWLYVYPSNGLETSAINLALGGSPVAPVNYWHNDPLTSYSNPAFPSMHKGFSFSQSGFKFIEADDDAGKLDYRSSLLGISYNKIS